LKLRFWFKPKDQQLKTEVRKHHPYKPEAPAREKLSLAGASGLYRPFRITTIKAQFQKLRVRTPADGSVERAMPDALARGRIFKHFTPPFSFFPHSSPGKLTSAILSNTLSIRGGCHAHRGMGWGYCDHRR
jgi:hypothetical protein